MGTIKMYGVGLVTCFVMDMIWLGLLARDFYQRHFGQFMRPDTQWLPAVLFYLLYVAALAVFVATPAAAARSVRQALLRGAFFGIAAYAAFDLTGLALFKDFPLQGALVDLAWGAVLSATVSAAMAAVGARSRG